MGGERGGVELERGVHHTRRLARQILERAEVRRGQGERPAPGKPHERRGGQRRPFGGIGPAPDLVEEDERGVVGMVKNPAKHPNVRAERRETRRDRLAVADVGIEAAEDRETGARPHRRHDAALRQRGGETHRLEEHRLAAGIGTTDEERAFVGAEVEIERYHRSGTGKEKRVTPAADRQRGNPDLHLGHLTLHDHRVARPGDEIVHRDEHLDQVAERLELRTQDIGELAQHPERLPLLFRFGFPKGVAELDGLGGLDEERARASRLVVDDSGGPRTGVAPHRDDVPPTAHGDAGVVCRGVGVEPAQQRLEFSDQPIPGDVHLAPRGGQPGARGVEHIPFRVDRLLEPALDALIEHRTIERRRERRLAGHAAKVHVHLASGDENPMEAGKLSALQHAALDPEAAKRAGHIGNRLGEEAVAPAEERGHLAHARQLDADPGRVGRRPAGQHPRPPEGPDGMRRDELNYLRELDGLERVGAGLVRQRRRGATLSMGRHPVSRDRFRLRHQPA